MKRKTASSQAAWALLMEGIAAARLEAHRLHHLTGRATALVGASTHKEHIHQVAGDIIQGIPRRLERLETILDRTSYAMTLMGKDFLASRLSISDKTLVEQSVESAFGGGMRRDSMAARVAARYLQARGSKED